MCDCLNTDIGVSTTNDCLLRIGAESSLFTDAACLWPLPHLMIIFNATLAAVTMSCVHLPPSAQSGRVRVHYGLPCVPVHVMYDESYGWLMGGIWYEQNRDNKCYTLCTQVMPIERSSIAGSWFDLQTLLVCNVLIKDGVNIRLRSKQYVDIICQCSTSCCSETHTLSHLMLSHMSGYHPGISVSVFGTMYGNYEAWLSSCVWCGDTQHIISVAELTKRHYVSQHGVYSTNTMLMFSDSMSISCTGGSRYVRRILYFSAVLDAGFTCVELVLQVGFFAVPPDWRILQFVMDVGVNICMYVYRNVYLHAIRMPLWCRWCLSPEGIPVVLLEAYGQWDFHRSFMAISFWVKYIMNNVNCDLLFDNMILLLQRAAHCLLTYDHITYLVVASCVRHLDWYGVCVGMHSVYVVVDCLSCKVDMNVPSWPLASLDGCVSEGFWYSITIFLRYQAGGHPNSDLLLYCMFPHTHILPNTYGVDGSTLLFVNKHNSGGRCQATDRRARALCLFWHGVQVRSGIDPYEVSMQVGNCSPHVRDLRCMYIDLCGGSMVVFFSKTKVVAVVFSRTFYENKDK